MSGCWPQRSEEQRLPKSEWPESIETERKTRHSGQFTPKSETGNSPREKSRPTNGSSDFFLSFILRFCLFVLFAASKRNITIGSHNLHSFKQSAAYHKECLKSHGGIWFSQELWLSDKQLPCLQQLGTQFVARSGMEKAVSDGLLVGRPFGGVGIAWSPDLNDHVMPLSNLDHKRVVGVEVNDVDHKLLMISVYMPFFNSSRRAECVAETVDTITMLETIIEQYPDNLIVIGGDLNTELKGSSPFDRFWMEFMRKNKLESCDRFFPADSFTYHHKGLNQKKWIDHFLVSEALLPDKIHGCSILDEGDNLSDHLPITLNLAINASGHSSVPPTVQPCRKLLWEKITPWQINDYTQRLSALVDVLPPPEVELRCGTTCICSSSSCKQSIQEEYDGLLQCLKSADSFLPRFKGGIAKGWWTDDLSKLKNKSIEVHNAWKNAGKPQSGPINEERLRVRAAYKLAIRKAQREPNQETWDSLHTAFTQKDTNSFWKSWRHLHNKKSSDLPSVVAGISSKKGIAEAFKDSFEQNSKPNNPAKVELLEEKFKTEFAAYEAKHRESCDCAKIDVTAVNVIDALLCMKGGKSADADEISVEHLHNAPINFLLRLARLFTHMLRHSFVPSQFQSGHIIPLIKDQQGSKADIGNYRGITISPIVSKIFEHVLKMVFFDHLETSQYQFGLKKNSSTVHALHCLRETVNYFVNHGSRVFCAFLDASKAFDRLVHAGLFLKLMKRNVPFLFINIIIFWYGNLLCRVKWGDEFSDWFLITAGVRQGGILSPDFYSIYVDDLLAELRKSKLGCYYGSYFAAALFYADDMALLAPSLRGLGHLLAICGDYCTEWDICLNPKKSKCMYFGSRINIAHNVTLKDTIIEWVNEWPYLGVVLKSSKCFDCSVKERIRKFYRSANAIFRIDGKPNDTILLNLVQTHCVPVLTYAIEIITVCNRDERRQLRVAYNSLFRKIFHNRWSESVSALQAFLERPTWEELVERRRNSFLNRVRQNGPNFLSCRFLL